MSINSKNKLLIFDPYFAYSDVYSNDNHKLKAFESRYDELDQELKDFLINVEVVSFLEEKISIPFELSLEQSQQLATIVMENLVAEIYIADIARIIEERLKLDSEKSKQIGQLIVFDLFKPILEKLKIVHGQKFVRRQEEPIKNENANIVNLKQ